MADSTDNQDPTPTRLHKSKLTSVGAITALGLNAAKQLALYGIVCMHLDVDGFVQVARPGEVTLDALPEPEAIQHLVKQGYDDGELEQYLRGRDARLSR
jgi:hypothetical protein